MRESISARESVRDQEPRSRKGMFVLSVIAIVFLGLAASFLFGAFYRPYTAVYLTSGDVYYGKLSTFPGVTLHDPWFIQRTEDGNFSLLKFSDAFWKPGNSMRISSDKIIFTSRLQKDSPIVDAIEGKSPRGAIQEGAPSANQQGVQGGAANIPAGTQPTGSTE